MTTKNEQSQKTEVEAFITDMKKSGLSITGESVLFQRLLEAENWREQFTICSFQGRILGIEFSISREHEKALYDVLHRYNFAIASILECLANISGFSTEKLIFKLASSLWDEQRPLSTLQAQKQRIDDVCSKDADRRFEGTAKQIAEMIVPIVERTRQDPWLARAFYYVEGLSDIFVFARDKHGVSFGIEDYLLHLNLVNAIKLYHGWISPRNKINLPASVSEKLKTILDTTPGLDQEAVERIETDESISKIETFSPEGALTKPGWGLKVKALNWETALEKFGYVAMIPKSNLYLLWMLLEIEQPRKQSNG